MRQLGLFDRKAVPAMVHFFPMRCRRRHIEIVARNLLNREGVKRLKRWRLERGRVYDEMFLAGIRDEQTITVELNEFTQAVESEMRRQVVMAALGIERGDAA